MTRELDPRSHRWFTVPAALAVIAALVSCRSPVRFIAIAPPVVLLPFLVYAGVRGTHDATAWALTATRMLGGMLALGGVCFVMTVPPIGGLLLVVAASLLAAAGTSDHEPRLGTVTAVVGGLIGVATVVLAWLDADPLILFAAATCLVIGGVRWHVEARRAPLTAGIPTMTIAAGALPRATASLHHGELR